MTVKILLVEDNFQNLYLATFLLEHKGFEIIQAVSARLCLEYAFSCNPDLILLDIQLPDVDGYTLAQMLKADPLLKEIPIVVTTAHAMVGDREKSLSLGVEGYIEKPINPETFVAEVASYLRKSA